MKALGLHFSIYLFGACLIGGPGAVRGETASSAWSTPSHPSFDAVNERYPNFCSIPPAPTQLRSPAAFRSAVLDTRRAGRDVVIETRPETFGLVVNSAAPFANRARREAAPPPPMNPQDVIEAEAFAREARKRAAPPKDPR